MTANIKAYQALCKIADETHWPEKYANDLYQIDRDVLCSEKYGKAPTVFGWILRDWGTHLFDPRDDSGGSWTAESIHRNFSGQSYKESDCLFYWYAYGELKRCTLDAFCDRFNGWKRYYSIRKNQACEKHGNKNCATCDREHNG